MLNFLFRNTYLSKELYQFWFFLFFCSYEYSFVVPLLNVSEKNSCRYFCVANKYYSVYVRCKVLTSKNVNIEVSKLHEKFYTLNKNDQKSGFLSRRYLVDLD